MTAVVGLGEGCIVDDIVDARDVIVGAERMGVHQRRRDRAPVIALKIDLKQIA